MHSSLEMNNNLLTEKTTLLKLYDQKYQEEVNFQSTRHSSTNSPALSLYSAAHPNVPIRHWTVGHVQRWLASTLALPAPILASFANAAIDGPMLLTLTEDELQYELGVTALLHKRKLVNAIFELQSVAHEQVQSVKLDMNSLLHPTTHALLHPDQLERIARVFMRVGALHLTGNSTLRQLFEAKLSRLETREIINQLGYPNNAIVNCEIDTMFQNRDLDFSGGAQFSDICDFVAGILRRNGPAHQLALGNQAYDMSTNSTPCVIQMNEHCGPPGSDSWYETQSLNAVVVNHVTSSSPLSSNSQQVTSNCNSKEAEISTKQSVSTSTLADTSDVLPMKITSSTQLKTPTRRNEEPKNELTKDVKQNSKPITSAAADALWRWTATSTSKIHRHNNIPALGNAAIRSSRNIATVAVKEMNNTNRNTAIDESKRRVQSGSPRKKPIPSTTSKVVNIRSRFDESLEKVNNQCEDTKIGIIHQHAETIATTDSDTTSKAASVGDIAIPQETLPQTQNHSSITQVENALVLPDSSPKHIQQATVAPESHVSSTPEFIIAPQDLNGNVLVVGDRVEARFNRGAHFRTATILAIHKPIMDDDQPTYRVQYDDGDRDENLTGTNLRKLPDQRLASKAAEPPLLVETDSSLEMPLTANATTISQPSINVASRNVEDVTPTGAIDMHGNPLCVSDRVLAHYHGRSQTMYPGTVVRVIGAAVSIQYDDGDVDSHLIGKFISKQR